MPLIDALFFLREADQDHLGIVSATRITWTSHVSGSADRSWMPDAFKAS